MDFLKKGQAILNSQNSGASSGQPTQGGAAPAAGQQPAAGQPAAGNTGNEDYGDKALDFLEKKSGHTLGRDTNEKITDGARGLYEKATGSKVDPKYSN